MDVIQLERHAYIKISVLRWGNARECHSELVGRTLFPKASTSSLWHALAFLPCSTAILMQARCSIKSHPFYKTLDLQPNLFRPLCNNSIPHCPLLQCIHTTSTILAGAHSYVVVSSFKCEEKIVAMT